MQSLGMLNFTNNFLDTGIWKFIELLKICWIFKIDPIKFILFKVDGVTSLVVDDGMTRAPALLFNNITDAV